MWRVICEGGNIPSQFEAIEGRLEGSRSILLLTAGIRLDARRMRSTDLLIPDENSLTLWRCVSLESAEDGSLRFVRPGDETTITVFPFHTGIFYGNSESPLEIGVSDSAIVRVAVVRDEGIRIVRMHVGKDYFRLDGQWWYISLLSPHTHPTQSERMEHNMLGPGSGAYNPELAAYLLAEYKRRLDKEEESR
jgi:hypothetical protein